MKKYILPVILFSAVFAVCFFFQGHTMASWEYEGLFLFTPDYFREALSGPWPISGLISDFLVQFFYYPALGALIMAVLLTATFLCIRRVFFFIPVPVVPTLASCASWWFSARYGSPDLAVRIFLLSAVAAGIVTLLKNIKVLPGRNATRKAPLWPEIICCLAICSAAPFIASNPEIRSSEKWASLQAAVREGRWDDALAVATPAETGRDRQMLPYALLALGESGRLPYKIMEYPVESEKDFDMGDMADGRSFSFNAALAASMGNYSEAIHGTFQAACIFKHNTSFGTLRELVKYNALSGNRPVVCKYVSVLSRSILNSGFGSRYLQMMPEMRDTSSVNLSWMAPVRSHGELANLNTAMKYGYGTRAVMDRVLCYLLVMGRRDLFVENFRLLEQYYPEIPPLFKGAL